MTEHTENETLDPTVWRQTSRKYRMIARLPEGETGLEAIKRCSPKDYERIMKHAERMASSSYLIHFAEQEGNSQILSTEAFETFRKNGGSPL